MRATDDENLLSVPWDGCFIKQTSNLGENFHFCVLQYVVHFQDNKVWHTGNETWCIWCSISAAYNSHIPAELEKASGLFVAHFA